MNKFKGIFPALVTPYTKDGAVNEYSLRRIVRLGMERECAGFYVGGSTAEAFILSMEERKTILDIVADEVSGRATIIYHVGTIGTADAIELAKHGKRVGVDAISAVPPFYYNFSIEEIKRHYWSIVDSVDLPMLVYNFPAFSGVNFSARDLEELMDHERIIGLKHTSMNLFDLERVKQKTGAVVLNGYDEMFLGSLAMGADGAIGSTFNLMADKFVRIQRLFQEGDLESALKLQIEANNVIEAIIKVGVIQGIKYGLEKTGIECNGCREPFKTVSAAERAELDRAFDENNVYPG
jgi:N-acetylneuraminate lyase